MELRLYNTLTRRKEVFRPLDPARVRMYVCGPTVYDYAHIGNARPVIVFDVLYRLLRHLYGPEHVTYVRNITDVDDKIIAAAREEGVPIDEITSRTTRAFHEDVAALGCLPPDFEPRATDYVRRTDGKLDMVTLITRLIDKGCAYVAEGHVLFDVTSMPDYGKLARRSLDEMIAGARVEVAPYKRNPMDFVLWKPSKAGEPAWDSPWGRGRPGWHIECSAMSAALLGETFDIHGGGVDLVFPHHENEIAQSRCAFGTPLMAQVWMHNGFLQVEGEKMAKSEGNIIPIRQLLDEEHPEVLRLQMLMTHYRQPIDWTESGRKQARATLNHWYHWTDGFFPADGLSDRIMEALLDDLNTPEAFTRMTQELDPMLLRSVAQFFGFLRSDLLAWQRWRPRGAFLDEGKVEELIAIRNTARKARDFKEADRIRDELRKMGVELHDTPEGTKWEVAR